MNKIPAGGGTGLYQALGFGTDHLRGVEGRKALVVFTDGVDDTLLGMYEQTANVTFSEVFEKVQKRRSDLHDLAGFGEDAARLAGAGGQ